MTKPVDAWFTDANVPATGLTPKLYIVNRETGTSVSGSPFDMTEKGNGWYSYTTSLNGGNYLGMIDGGASLTNDAERYKTVVI